MMYTRNAANTCIDQFVDSKTTKRTQAEMRFKRIINFARKIIHKSGERVYKENYCQFVIGDFTFMCHPDNDEVHGLDCGKKRYVAPRSVEILYKGELKIYQQKYGELVGFSLGKCVMGRLEEIMRQPDMQKYLTSDGK